MTKKITLCVVLAGALFSAVPAAFGQGCIISRSNGEVGGPESEGGYLEPGEWNFGIGYRHQFSFRHFVGPTEQTYRIQQGNQVMNKLNLQNYSATYQFTKRFSASVDVPLLLASRHTHNSAITYTTQGIGDVAFMVNGWVFNTSENSKGNIQFGVGMVLPTGKNNLTNVVSAVPGGPTTTTVVDYSIQPGQGGWGMPLQWVSFRNVHGSQLYFNGTYTAMFQSINKNTIRSATVNPLTLTQFNSISDQYLLEAGIAHPVPKVKGLTFTFGPRWEGAPARNLIPGDNLGFRRPGFAISLEPGFQYARSGQVLSVQVGKAFYRDRTKSVPDTLTGGHGDAAFADYVWLASYSFRMGGKHRMAQHPDTPDTPHSAASSSATNSSHQ